MAAILTGEPGPLSRYSRAVPAGLERIVRRSLEKNPAARYASAEALRRDLTELTARHGRPPAKRWPLVAGACIAIAALAFAFAFSVRREPAASFHSMQITRIATRGEALDAAISRDGKLLAYVVNEGAGQSVWIENSAGGNEVAVVAAEPGEHSGVVFSPDDAYLYYRHREAGETGVLYRVPVKGGAPARVMAEVSGAATLSPDGRRLAFVRLKPSSWEASLAVANADGSGEFTVATVQRPKYFDQHNVAWSPDGRSIACFAGESAHYAGAAFHLVEVRLDDGSQHAITAHPWKWPRSVAWTERGDVLIVTTATRGDDGYQLWTVARHNGSVTRLTNDLSNYDRVTVTGDGKALATVQSDSATAIWTAPGGDTERAVRISATPIRSHLVSVTWTPDGHILYSDPTGSSGNLWSADADGANRRRFAPGPDAKYELVATADGRYVVYKQDGNIWRINADGTNPQKLTEGSLDVHPDVSADGRAVVYASFADWSPSIGGAPALWKVPIEGGKPAEISRQPASYPRMSADGRRLGCIYFPGKDPRFSADHLAVLGLDGSGGFRMFDASPSDETPIAFSPDGKGLDYILNKGNTGNIWRQPLDSGPARQVTRFASDEIYSFAWSRDGRLACARGTVTRGMVVIRDFD